MCCRKDVVTPNISAILPSTTNTGQREFNRQKGVYKGGRGCGEIQIEGYLRNP
jgi:hypothetical protein